LFGTLTPKKEHVFIDWEEASPKVSHFLSGSSRSEIEARILVALLLSLADQSPQRMLHVFSPLRNMVIRVTGHRLNCRPFFSLFTFHLLNRHRILHIATTPRRYALRQTT
jgi:hypothetical protein